MNIQRIRLIALVVTIVVAATGFALDAVLTSAADAGQHTQAQVVATSAAERIRSFVHKRQASLQVMARNWPDNHPNIDLWFSQHAADLMEIFEHSKAVVWYDASGALRAVRTATGQVDSALYQGLLPRLPLNTMGVHHQGSLKHLQSAVQTQMLSGLIIPRNTSSNDYSAIMLVWDTEQASNAILAPIVGNEYALSLANADGNYFSVGDVAAQHPPAHAQLDFDVERLGHFSLDVWTLHKSYNSSDLVLGFSLVLAALLGLGVRAALLRTLRLRMNQARYQIAGQAGLDGLVMMARQANGTLTVVDANPMATSLMRREQAELIGIDQYQLAQLCGSSALADEIDQVAQSGGKLSRRYQSLRDNRWYKVQLVYAQNLVAITLRDVTERVELYQQISHQAHHDALTGLYNRYHFDELLKSRIAQASSIGKPSWLFYFDLDQFKAVNDSCGHGAGDALLKQLSQMLQRGLLRECELTRLGGDEFAVITPPMTETAALALTQTTLKQIREFRFGWQGQLFQVGASGGLVAIAPHFSCAPELLRAADSACYIAKEHGGNQLHLYSDDEATQQRQQELKWFGHLRHALEQRQFALYAQPIVDLQASRTNPGNCYEVLLRLRDEHGQMVSPAVFIPAAERYGVMPDIDLWVVSHTLNTLRDHPGHLRQLRRCSINLSAATLAHTQHTDALLSMIEHSGVDAHKICFEITETAAISRIDKVQLFIEKARALGCKFALDDFGAGMTSFAYLKDLSIDYLKIDGQFIKHLDTDPRDRALVQAFKDVGSSMAMQLVAEFVENDDITEILQQIGIDFGQGFGLAKPMPLDELIAQPIHDSLCA